MLFADDRAKKYGITPLCEPGKEKYISGAADFGAVAWRSHGFRTRPASCEFDRSDWLVVKTTKVRRDI